MPDEIQKEVEQEKLSLRDFIEEYQKTLACVGVLIVLGSFWKSIYATDETPYVSYLCFLATLPLLYEIVRAYDYHRFAWNLYFFVVILIGIFVYSAGYILSNFLDHTITILTGALWSASMIGIHTLINSIAHKIKTKKYEEAKAFSDEVHSRNDLTQEKRNEIVTSRNEMLQRYYEHANRFAIIALIIAGLLTSIMVFKFDGFLHEVLKSSKPFREVPAITVPESTPPPV